VPLGNRLCNVLRQVYLTSRAAVAHTSGDAGDNQVDQTIVYRICAAFLIARKGAAAAAIAWSLRALVDGVFLFLLASYACSAKY
jgi:hypothetical protein